MSTDQRGVRTQNDLTGAIQTRTVSNYLLIIGLILVKSIKFYEGLFKNGSNGRLSRLNSRRMEFFHHQTMETNQIEKREKAQVVNPAWYVALSHRST